MTQHLMGENKYRKKKKKNVFDAVEIIDVMLLCKTRQ